VKPIYKDKHWIPIANNPNDDQLYSKKENDSEKRYNKRNTLFGSATKPNKLLLKRLLEVTGSRTTASGDRVPRDEPSEPQKTQHLRVDKKQYARDLEFWTRRNNQAVARERLKRKGAVPTKSGKRLFDDFYGEAITHSIQKW